MAKQSAGILIYRMTNDEPEFFLVHPGGPFFRNKNEGWWTVPKGEIQAGEEPLTAALRELEEETGYVARGQFIPLTSITQKGGKSVQCWAVQGDLDSENIICNEFEIEWPPRSGKKARFPEIDKADWFKLIDAEKMINLQQSAFLRELFSFLQKK